MASGATLIIFNPFQNEPPTSNYATIDTRNNRPVLDFDGATNESAVFTGVMPQNYAGTTGITVRLYFSMTTDTTNDVDWDVQFERIGTVLDTDSDSFASVRSSNNTAVPGTAGVIGVATIAFLNGAEIDNIVAGEMFRIRVTRDAASDTSTTDAELHAIELRET